METDILALDAVTLQDRIAAGTLTATAVTEACCARIADQEPHLRAWAWHDPDFARTQAAQLDRHRESGQALGPLHGVPVGLKDVIDTAGIPTENGIELDAGRVPSEDAFVVERLKAAGAVLMGKTVSTPLQFLDPGPTRNPRNPDHTPGGSSSGSAAAVASAMIPAALGTQTGGSIIRPASFCGVTGYKPTFGAIPRTGTQQQSQSLDTLGVLARSPLDAALIAEVLFGHDMRDPATSIRPFPTLLDTARTAPSRPPVFAFVKPPEWDRADPQVHRAFDDLVADLGDQVFEFRLPAEFDNAAADRRIINLAEMARNFHRYGQNRAALGPHMVSALAEGRTISAVDYLHALERKPVLYAALKEIFCRCDAILTPAALGPAPQGLTSTGDAIFNGLWTLIGTPAVTIPVLTAENGLPMGVQLVGPRHGDGQLLRTANWLWTKMKRPVH